jgi:hypothetical protein
MIIFDFECTVCGYIEEKIVENGISVSSCSKCDSISKKIFTPTKFIPFKKFVVENVGDEPLEVTSWKQLDAECEKRGLSYSIGRAKNSSTMRLRDKLKQKVQRRDYHATP